LSAGLGKPQLSQRSQRHSPTCVRNDAQLEHSDRREFDEMVFRLGGCSLGTEVPLLPHDFPERPPAIRRPTQDVLLRSLSADLHEFQPDPPEPLRIGKEKPDRLLSRPCRAPPRGAATREQRGLNRISGVLRGDFDFREPLQIQPGLLSKCGFILSWDDYSLAHLRASRFQAGKTPSCLTLI
jgi:hypothetical protein